MEHVIIGAGPAGVVAAETLHKLDPASSVTIVGDEPEPPYSRMALPYYLIERIDESGTYLRKDAGHFRDLGIGLKQGRVESVSPGERRLRLADGSTLSYDRLLVATGSRPATPPVPGIDLPAVHACWTLEDGRNIARLAKPGAKVILMGAGFIGCIILEALAKRKVELTVVEMADRMVPRMMSNTAGTMIKKWCELKRVNVFTSTKITSIEKGSRGHALKVRLDNGKDLAADLVIQAAGVRPNVEFLQGSGIEVEHGILVDNHLETSVPDIFAAGDVAEGRDFSTGEYSVQAIQPTAVEHGRLAALNMAGRNVAYPGSVNMNVLDTMGLISSSFGLWMGVDGGDAIELHEPEAFRYLNLQFDGDVLVGAHSLGLTQHVGVLRGLIQTRLPLKDWKGRLAKDPTRIMEAYLGSTQLIA
jgi:NADPH-dependent 2,4-dienoyl-CoA reductase/sulfur reductase-like enzyme